jgi:hypothetical protein
MPPACAGDCRTEGIVVIGVARGCPPLQDPVDQGQSTKRSFAEIRALAMINDWDAFRKSAVPEEELWDIRRHARTDRPLRG